MTSISLSPNPKPRTEEFKSLSPSTPRRSPTNDLEKWESPKGPIPATRFFASITILAVPDKNQKLIPVSTPRPKTPDRDRRVSAHALPQLVKAPAPRAPTPLRVRPHENIVTLLENDTNPVADPYQFSTVQLEITFKNREKRQTVIAKFSPYENFDKILNSAQLNELCSFVNILLTEHNIKDACAVVDINSEGVLKDGKFLTKHSAKATCSYWLAITKLLASVK